MVAEAAKGRLKTRSRSKLAALVLVIFPLFSLAGLEDAVIVGGKGVIVNPNLVQQHSSRLAINAQSFNVGIGETFTINQNYTTDLALIRVLGQNPSSIFGSIRAIGQLFISNPNGLLIGSGAEVNVGGFLGTSLDISSEDFMAGNMVFHNRGGAGAVVNRGQLTAAEGGYIALLAPEVRNEGVISATLGKVLLASGDKVTLTLNNGVLFDYSIDQGTFNGLVENKHLIQADGGQIFMSGKAADALTSSVVNNTGILRARTVQNQGGVIKLIGDMQAGTVNVGGIIDASAPQGGNGGFVETSAAQVNVEDGAQISTLSAMGDNGTWLIDPQDYIIGAGGNITGATLSANLGFGNVTILSSGGSTSGNGDIHVNENVSWSANNLTLTAARDINVNAVMTASGTSTLTLNPATANGADAAVAGGTLKMGINPGGSFKGRIDLPGRSGNGIITIGGQGYAVINSLGAEGSTSGSDLQGINGNLAGRYVMGGDIDASATSGWNGGLGFAPLSTFTGSFEGFGHTVSNLTINRPTNDFIGMFAVASNATIRNIGLENAAVTGQNGTAGLVGLASGSTRIVNSYVTGEVKGVSGVGGLVGQALGSLSLSGSHATSNVSGVQSVGGLLGSSTVSVLDISNTLAGYSYASGNVTATGSHVGGIIGYQYGGVVNIVDYTSTAEVVGGGRVGGLLGISDSATLNITNTIAGNVSASGGEVGGFVGMQFGGTIGINGSMHAGNVTGNSYVGGLVGNNFIGTLDIHNSTAGSVTGSNGIVGGLVGYATATHISNSYVTNAVTGTIYTGGLVGSAGGTSTINDSYVTGAVNGTNNVGGLVGALAGAASINASQASGAINGVDTVGGLVGFAIGTASIGASYATGDVYGSGNMVGGVVGHYASTSTLNLSGSDGVDTYATGNVTGLNSVGGLVGAQSAGTININNNFNATGTAGSVTATLGGQYVGGLVGENIGGVLNIENSTAGIVTASTTSDYVGGLVGSMAAGNILYSYYAGNITGRSYIGGLVGETAAGSWITESFASGNVGSVNGSNIGGLAGLNGGTITDAYATGAVNGAGATNVGGLVGANAGSITRTYAAGAVSGSTNVGGLAGANSGTVNDSYWDLQSSGMMTSAGGTGKTTTEMKTLSTFAGWNIDDTGNTGKTWRIYGTHTAPLLRYFMAPVTITGGGGSVVYSGTFQSGIGMTYTDSVTGLPLDTSSPRFSRIVTGAYKNVGIYAVSYSDQLGYDITGEYFTITPAPLTVTANNDSKIYDGQSYVGGNGISYSGFVGGETSAVLAGSLIYGGSSQGAKDVGLYSITPSGLSALNYSLTYVDGSLQIKPQPVSPDSFADRQTYLAALNSGNYYQKSGQTIALNTPQYIDRSSCGPGAAAASPSDQRFAASEASSFALDGNDQLDSAAEGNAESISSDELTVTILNGGARYPENRAVKAHGLDQLKIMKSRSGGME